MIYDIAISCLIDKSKGYGNFQRVFILGKSLSERGLKIVFLINYNSEIQKILEHESLEYKIISNKIPFSNKPNSLLTFLKKSKCRVIILDMREYGEFYSKKLSKYDVTVISIDDAFMKNIYSDFYFNGSLIKTKKDLSLKIPNAKIFLGPKYFIALPKLIKYRKNNTLIKKKQVYTILISFGGSDPSNLTEYVLKQIYTLSNVKIIVILGPLFKNDNSILEFSKNKKYIIIKKSPTDIYKEFSLGDILITKGGLTLYESAILGIPSITLDHFIHEYQSSVKFQSKKITIALEKHLHHTIKKTVVGLLLNVEKRKKMNKNGIKTMDEKGLERIIKIIQNMI
jgi:spore coat polysaccharide biosynthesis predicted glycosyltransferase SpsG